MLIKLVLTALFGTGRRILKWLLAMNVLVPSGVEALHPTSMLGRLTIVVQELQDGLMQIPAQLVGVIG